MTLPEAGTRQSAWMLSVYILALLLLICLNGLPYFVSGWSDQLAGKHISSIALKSILLQCIDDLQESLIWFLQPLFDILVWDVLSGEEEAESRRQITKADSFITVVRVFAVKLPSVGVTLLLILPKTTVSTFVCILVAAAWCLIFPDAAKAAQKGKQDRDRALLEKRSDAEECQESYLRSLSGLFARLFSWNVIRNGCLFLFVLFSPGLDPTLMTRFVHQVAALEKIMLKGVLSYNKARKIVKVLAMNKLPCQSTVVAVTDKLMAASSRCRVLNTGCIGKLHARARKHFKSRPLLPVTRGRCHGGRVAIWCTAVGGSVAEKVEWSFQTMRRCLQRPALVTGAQEYRPLLAAEMSRCAAADV
ncbi:hypothetical protein CORC01_10812 [Colletotrichum orchidophilum]|uniref:Uncharacterized protein n=1 Tax=Colletotrichum orchidophilum TaxID=1209926 RepID=A0A1G4AXU9_9PEZI|nr:uncharacterized protein CORC01_10812 [Colletotrichum orchidophilum]OHE93913.1 hypothetical protein CORC01_10812 [Colletotrichum orchidophilum]